VKFPLIRDLRQLENAFAVRLEVYLRSNCGIDIKESSFRCVFEQNDNSMKKQSNTF